MASNPLLSAGNNWTQRAKTFQQLGIPEDIYAPVLRDDIKKVARGHQGMSDAEAYTSIAASHLKQSIIGEGKKPSLNPLANIADDITGIVKALNPVTLARFAGREVSHLGGMLTGSYNPFEGDKSLPDYIKSLSDVPIVNLIPGVYTAGNIATGSEGAREAAAHPVGTFLDLLPFAGTAGKAAANAGKVGALDDAGRAATGSVTEALRTGNPIKAGYRALPEDLRGKIAQVARDKGLSPAIRDAVMRPMAGQNLPMRFALTKLMKEEIQPVVGGKAKRMPQAELDKQGLIARGLGQVDEMAEAKLDAIRGISDEQIGPVAGQARRHGDEVKYNGEYYSVHNKWGPNTADNPRGGPNPIGLAIRELGEAQDNVMKLANELDRGRVDGGNPLVRMDDGSFAEGAPGTMMGRRSETRLKKLEVAEQKAKNAQTQVDFLLAHEAPLRAMPVLREARKARVQEIWDADGLPPEAKTTMEEAAQQLAAADDPHSLRNLMSEKAWKYAWEDEINWQKHLSSLGVNPILLANTRKSALSHMLHPKILAENNPSPKMFQDYLFDLTPVYSDVTMGLTEMTRQALVSAGTEAFIRSNVDNGVTRPKNLIMDELRATYQRRGKSDPAAAAAEHFDKKYRKYNVPKYIKDTLPPELAHSDLFIDRNMLKAMEVMEGKHMGNDLPFKGGFDNANQLFRNFVLTSPRHLAHIALGGLLFMTLRKPMSLMEIPNIRRISAQLKRGEFPSEITASLEQTASDSVGRYAYASTLGRMFSDIAGSPVRALDKVENWLVSMQKAMVFESELKGQVRKGAPSAAAHEVAMKETLKTLVDMDAMTVAERTILKQIFPFYGFVRHQFRYLFTLPIDHPYRVAILTRFAEQEKEEWDSGLPQKMQSLWIFGPKDGGGGQWNLDAKTFNPFRSFGDMFAWSGFFQTLSPVVSAPFNAAGFDTLSGTSELYPESTYDPEYGTIVAKRPTGMGPRLLQQFIPQVEAIDHMLQYSDDMKGLKEASPEAYRNQLFSSIGIPFVRHKVNVSQTRAKTELRKFQIAQQAVSDAIREGDPSLLDNYTVVPFNGRLVDSDALKAMIMQLGAEAEPLGVSPRAILSNSRNIVLPEVPE